jgi:hypothetical protein
MQHLLPTIQAYSLTTANITYLFISIMQTDTYIVLAHISSVVELKLVKFSTVLYLCGEQMSNGTNL